MRILEFSGVAALSAATCFFPVTRLSAVITTDAATGYFYIDFVGVTNTNSPSWSATPGGTGRSDPETSSDIVSTGELFGYNSYQPFASASSNIPNGFGFNVSVSGGTGVATLYDTTRDLGNDDDLEWSTGNGAPPNDTNWQGGNLEGTSTLQRAIIIQENFAAGDQSRNRLAYAWGGDDAGGVAPDDASSSALLTLEFETPLQEFGWAWADNEEGDIDVIFTNTNGTPSDLTDDDVVSVSFQTLGSNPAFNNDNGVGASDFEDGYANDLGSLTAAELVAYSAGFADPFISDRFDQVTFDFGGPGNSSGGVGFIYGYQIPEPATAALLLGACSALGVALLRRRNRMPKDEPNTKA